MLGLHFTPRLREMEFQLPVSPPGDSRFRLMEAHGKEQWIVGSFLELDSDVFFGDIYGSGRVDEVAEYVARSCRFIPVAQLGAEQPIEAACHNGQL